VLHHQPLGLVVGRLRQLAYRLVHLERSSEPAGDSVSTNPCAPSPAAWPGCRPSPSARPPPCPPKEKSSESTGNSA
jgi:hypothetical protein